MSGAMVHTQLMSTHGGYSDDDDDDEDDEASDRL